MISSRCFSRASLALISLLLTGHHSIASAQTNQARPGTVGSIESRLNLNTLNSRTLNPSSLRPSTSKLIPSSAMQALGAPQHSFAEKELGAAQAHSLLPSEQNSLHNLLVLPLASSSLKDIGATRLKQLQLFPANINGQTTNKTP